MKKLIAVLLFSLMCTGIYAQVKANAPYLTVYANGDSYGYYIDPIPGAISYEWSTLGNTGAIIWPAWDTAIDITFSHPGMCDVICMVTMDNGTVVEYGLSVDVYEED